MKADKELYSKPDKTDSRKVLSYLEHPDSVQVLVETWTMDPQEVVGANSNMKTQLGFDGVVREEKVEEGDRKHGKNKEANVICFQRLVLQELHQKMKKDDKKGRKHERKAKGR
ncbi:hypothetical protein NQZ68_020147 [Dissostichus eleginoides]|nr:hypothetical protein NQZ68_020147 [Dissostichus eleginoides]